MKKIVASLLILSFYGTTWAQTSEKNFIDQNYIEVRGKAEKEITPDMIYLTIVINESDNKAKQPLEELERQMVKKLQDIGVEVEKDLSVVDFVSNFKDYLLRKNEIMTSKTFQLICHQSGTVKRVFVELEKLGISNISILKLDHSNIIELQKEVRKEAASVSKEKAAYLLEAMDQKAGKVLYAEEVINYPMQRNYLANTMRMEKSYEDKYKEPELEFEKIKLEAEMLVRVAIE